MFLVKFLIISTSITHFNSFLVKSDTDSAATYNGRNTTDCDPPEFIENGMLEVRNSYSEITFGNGTFIKYSCALGYKLEPTESKIRYCINGTWTNTNPYCVHVLKITCPKPDEIPNGFYVSSDQGEGPFEYGDKVEYECKSEFTLIGPQVRTCESNGEWLPPKIPFCTPTYKVLETEQLQACPPPPKVPNTIRKLIRGTQRANDAIPGATFEFVCDSGYRDTKSPCVASILRCDNGSWKGSLPNCAKVESCHPPPEIDHGAIISPPFEGNYPISYEVMYSCVAGFVIFPKNLAALTLRCEENGCWAPNTLPTCHAESSLFFGLRNNYDDYFHLTAGGLLMCILFAIFGVTSIMVAICSLSICRQRYLYLRHRRRTARAENRTIPHAVSTSSIIRPNAYGRAAFIAFTDGIQVEQHHLPTYDEVLRQDRNISINGGIAGSDCVTSNGRLNNDYCGTETCDIPINAGSVNNGDNLNVVSGDTNNISSQRNVRFSNQPSESRYRSSRDIMGSTDTVAISEVSANTLDNVSSHTLGSGSQNPSCRAMCGSLASFDACSVINTEGFPLLEEYEVENETQANESINLRGVGNNK